MAEVDVVGCVFVGVDVDEGGCGLDDRFCGTWRGGGGRREDGEEVG